MFAQISKILEGRSKDIVTIKGWLYNKRSSGGILFLEISDGTGFIQCTLKKSKFEKEIFDQVEKLPAQSIVELTGRVSEDKRASYGHELLIDSAKILVEAEGDYPITKKSHGLKFILDNRHLSMRTSKMFHIMMIREQTLEFAREWLKKKGFREFHAPLFITAGSEGGSTLFEVKYFGKKAFLTQSWQLYGEAIAHAFGKVFTFGPSFRAEESLTRRHLSEFWHLEVEVPFCDFKKILEVQEDFITYVLHELAKKCKMHLEALGRDPQELLKITSPFPRITYKEALDILKKEGKYFEEGKRFGSDELEILSKKFERPVFITHYKKEMKPFYAKVDDSDPELVLFADLVVSGGVGEIIGSGERTSKLEELKKRMKESDLDEKDYMWYIELRKWGGVEHSGFGMGLERFVMWVCKLKNIRSAILFPRTMNRVYP